MGNESNCYALNRNSIKGRNVLALTDDNKVAKYQIFCTAEVYIEAAEFEAPYVGPHSLPRPQLRIDGVVSKVKLEDPNLVFPSGSKSLSFMPGSEEHVTLNYRLSDAEIATLATRGLFCNFEDRGYGYQPPANMINNTMDIPMNIVYYGIQNEPVALFEIIKPDEVPTETRLNTYFGIFDVAAFEQKVVDELEGRCYPNGLGEPLVQLPEADFIIKQREAAERLESQRAADEMANRYHVEDDQTEIVEEEDVHSYESVINPEDKDITDKINESIANAASRDESIHTNKSGFDAKGVVDAVKAEHAAIEAQKEFEIEQRDGVNYDRRADTSNVAKPTTMADKMELLRKMTESNGDEGQFVNENQGNPYEMLSQSTGMTEEAEVGSAEYANEQTDKSNEAIRRVDRALDNQALNAGITDIAGHGASDNNDDNKSEQNIGFDDVSSLLGGLIPDMGGDDSVSASDVREAEANKKREIARNVDRALDNQALNAGITDIAGHGAVSKPENDRSRDADAMVEGLKPTVNDSEQKFL